MSSAKSQSWCPITSRDCVAAENPYHKFKVPLFFWTLCKPTFDASPSQGYCSLNLNCKEKDCCFVFEAFEISVCPVNRTSATKQYRNYRAPMMDSLSTELTPQLYRNPSEINRWQTVVMNAILFWYWISETAKKKR